MSVEISLKKKTINVYVFLEMTRLKSWKTKVIPNHQYVPVHGMQWVWLIMVAPLVVSHVDGYWRVKGGEEMMGTCAGQTQRVRNQNYHRLLWETGWQHLEEFSYNIVIQPFHHAVASNVDFWESKHHKGRRHAELQSNSFGWRPAPSCLNVHFMLTQTEVKHSVTSNLSF